MEARPFGLAHHLRSPQGRPLSPTRQSVAILSPYFPYPLSHGGAVRIFHILREAARDFDIIYFSFAERIEPADSHPFWHSAPK